jgi:hypothetical protein
MRGLTLPSRGRPQAGFAHLPPPLMSNVRPLDLPEHAMKHYSGSEPPRLDPGEYSVSLAELATGIVLNLDGKRRFTGSTDDWIVIFESLSDAENFAQQQIARNPDIECVIKGEQGSFFRCIVAEASAPPPHVRKGVWAVLRLWFKPH